MSSTIGDTLRLTLYSRSHGPVIGMTLAGIPRRKGPVLGGAAGVFGPPGSGPQPSLHSPAGGGYSPDFSRA